MLSTGFGAGRGRCSWATAFCASTPVKAYCRARPLSGHLESELAAATSAPEASEVVVEHLARKGLMPSVYLEDGGRLRCQAVRGYWQIYDGMPATAGVIGRTFRTGEGDLESRAVVVMPAKMVF